MRSFGVRWLGDHLTFACCRARLAASAWRRDKPGSLSVRSRMYVGCRPLS